MSGIRSWLMWSVSCGVTSLGRNPRAKVRPPAMAASAGHQYDHAMLERRLINFAGAAACLGMFAFALYTEYFENLDPCPLCIFQRIAVVALGIAFLAAAIHNPRRWGAWVYAGLT